MRLRQRRIMRWKRLQHKRPRPRPLCIFLRASIDMTSPQKEPPATWIDGVPRVERAPSSRYAAASAPISAPNLYVHLDFKGLPLQPDCLCAHIELLKRCGVTGLVLEWEDMLPYHGSMAALAAPNAYTEYEVNKVLKAAEGLDIVPLVQTLGHCENMLRHSAFAMMREDPDDYGTLCPCHPDVPAHVKELIGQVLDFHPTASKLHIGCDEPTLGVNPLTRAAAQADPAGMPGVIVEHVARTAAAARSLGVREVLMWHDATRAMSDESLKARLLPTGVSLVVWDYGPLLTQTGFASSLCRLGHPTYVASAWKGADGAEAVLPDINARVANQKGWASWAAGISAAEKAPSADRMGRADGDGYQPQALEGGELLPVDSRSSFKGVVLTGWSRYGYTMPLTEMLHAGVPSLLACLALWQGAAAAVVPSRDAAASKSSWTADGWEASWRANPACASELHDLCVQLGDARSELTAIEETRRHTTRPVAAFKLRASPRVERSLRERAQSVLAKLKDIEVRARSSAKGFSMTTLLQLAFTGDADEFVIGKIDEAIVRAKAVLAAAMSEAASR